MLNSREWSVQDVHLDCRRFRKCTLAVVLSYATCLLSSVSLSSFDHVTCNCRRLIGSAIFVRNSFSALIPHTDIGCDSRSSSLRPTPTTATEQSAFPCQGRKPPLVILLIFFFSFYRIRECSDWFRSRRGQRRMACCPALPVQTVGITVCSSAFRFCTCFNCFLVSMDRPSVIFINLCAQGRYYADSRWQIGYCSPRCGACSATSAAPNIDPIA